MSDGYVIKEKYPDGAGSYKETLAWLNNIETRVADMTGLWQKLIPDVRQAFRYTFSDANPARWKEISPGYIQWKREMKFPDTIGIRTGTLKESLTESAIVKSEPKKLTWLYNDSLKSSLGEDLKDYAFLFNMGRPIIPFVKKYIQGFLKKSGKEYLAEGKSKKS
jgi:hypothetical protein